MTDTTADQTDQPATVRVPRRLSAGGPWEEGFGYSRAVRAGDRIVVSGCTSVVDQEVQHAGDAAAQMGVALDTALSAVEALGGTIGDVIRTRMYVVNRVDCDAVGRVHGARFADVRPAATLVLVAGLLHEQMLVEIELEAHVGQDRQVPTLSGSIPPVPRPSVPTTSIPGPSIPGPSVPGPSVPPARPDLNGPSS